MWSRTYSKTVTGIDAAAIWRVWRDVDRWAEWQDDLDFAKLDAEFAKGGTFTLKPKGGPRVKIAIERCDPERNFTDLTRFPLARMRGSHDIIGRGDSLELVTTVSIEGPLAFLWRRIVAQGVADGMPKQTDALVARARQIGEARS